jgi:hypothetical protein
MTEIQKPPTLEMLTLADLLERLVGSFLKAANAGPRLGLYESDLESYRQMALVVRHVEAVLSLARYDSVTLPSAMVLARAALEAAVRVQWMMIPDDPFDRELRWLAQYRDLAKFLQGLESEGDPAGITDMLGYGPKAGDQVRDDADRIEGMFPSGYMQLARIPSMETMFKNLVSSQPYLLYRATSQFVHGTQVATSLYKRNLGNGMIMGEFIEARHWRLCFEVCWESLYAAGWLWLERCDGDRAAHAPLELRQQFASGIKALESSGSAR